MSDPASAHDSDAAADAEHLHWGQIDGVDIEFPMVVESMNQATFTYTVAIEPARKLLVGDAFEVVDVGDGNALFVMALVDYRLNPWGDYNEVNFAVFAQPVGQPDHPGAFVYRMPVDQAFTAKAGNQVLGLPKTLETVDFDYGDDRVAVRLEMGGEPTLLVTFPRAEPTGAPSVADTVTYSYLDGAPTALPLAIELGTGSIDPATIETELGTSEAARELSSLGFPTAPDAALWGEGLRGTFHVPRTL